MKINMVQLNHPKNSRGISNNNFDMKHAENARKFHSTFPEYKPTPLVKLSNLADIAGVDSVYVKDESKRFGLNAFKVLGGSYSIGRCIAEKLGIPENKLGYRLLMSDDIKKKTGKLTFVTATDGNHGRGVAWTAARLGHRSVVYMPKGSSRERLENIRREGAEAEITDMNYDDAVRFANEKAEKNGWIMVQDTSWEGYEDIPRWIMEGYTTMALEAYEQLQGIEPTHIFLQAGVGAFAGAVAGFFSSILKAKPVITIVEPDKADCFYKTALANDGKIHTVSGDMDSMMAGLCCGEPCTIGWDVLSRCADNFVSMSDDVSAFGMRVLGNPAGDDERVISGESGAAGLGFAAAVLMKEEFRELKERAGLDEKSRILCISTEGATDIRNYRKVVWG